MSSGVMARSTDLPPAWKSVLRGAEMASAADGLGATSAQLPVSLDGALNKVSQTRLAAQVVGEAESCHADGLLAFDTAGLGSAWPATPS